jgi:hypothetical protein
MKDETKHFPGDQFEVQAKIDTRKSSFGKLARLMMNAGTAWPTSYPGQSFMAFDCLPDSTVPARLKALDYDPVYEGDGERILPHGITERYLIEGSTAVQVRHHAGVTSVRKFVFDL